jgi:hypothetical protein
MRHTFRCGECGERRDGHARHFRVGEYQGDYRNAYLPLCGDCLETYVVEEFNRTRDPEEQREFIRRVASAIMPAVIARLFAN